MRNTTDEHYLLVATLPPSQWTNSAGAQRRRSPSYRIRRHGTVHEYSATRVDAFIPSLETAIVFNDLITAALLFGQFYILRWWALLVLANGFLFTALIVIPHALTFPGAFAPTGLLGAGLQSTVSLYYFWHAGSPLAVIGYVLLKDTATKHVPALAGCYIIGLECCAGDLDSMCVDMGCHRGE